MYDLLILTTAINRPEIHKKTLLPIVQLLKKHNIHTKWIINLDIIDKFDNIDKSTKFFSKISYWPINIELIVNKEPCFFKAVRRLTTESLNYINITKCVLYLEDDWKLLENEYNNFIIKIMNSIPNTIIKIDLIPKSFKINWINWKFEIIF